MKQRSLLKLIMPAIVANLMSVQSLMANSSDLSGDFPNYISSLPGKGFPINDVLISNINNCALCHFDFNSFNGTQNFGFDFGDAGQNTAAFTAIELLDSDGDGT